MGFLAGYQPQLRAAFRIMFSLLFIEHATAKLFHFPHVAMFDGVTITSFLGVAGLIELVGGFLLLIGLFSEAVAFILSGEMAVAYFMVHAPQGFFPVLNMGEGAILYCFAFLYLAAAGPGAWSVDGLRHGR